MTQILQTPFGFASTSAEVLVGVHLSGTRALVTGASSGVGIKTARVLAGAGAAVVLGVRDIDAGKEIAARISESTGNRDVGVGRLDLADLGSPRTRTAEIRSRILLPDPRRGRGSSHARAGP
ncbi:SDR family NAD(P)-dependent oxidoreductase [Streptosporangium lutulentum]|uniref:NAD(P)-dependent dehydrogenase (Short-subunit alcohol dehydrogenase family) n=1 Tax=Streptosporangium lutulentum TaxID=1461250 RepID=A0ABT9Q9K3_9ACTN|nr:SDR family NAD(P)-dependent oxidoreductase [Streptosporangium lutulentum]MDP9843422.1 NAD(P)-dependent dehydrogenase (short-subunit alcohol dehydrogenase family) [Streptosporangium lutulentum]